MNIPSKAIMLSCIVTASLFWGGCDYLALTDGQLVKNRTREFAEAITAEDWRKAATFYDASVTWRQGNRPPLQGRAAARGFTATLHALHNMDEFFIIVDDTTKIKPDLIEAKVTMQAHIVISSTELSFTNQFWTARMGWVKRGPGKWLISYIIETSPRREGDFSRI